MGRKTKRTKKYHYTAGEVVGLTNSLLPGITKRLDAFFGYELRKFMLALDQARIINLCGDCIIFSYLFVSKSISPK